LQHLLLYIHQENNQTLFCYIVVMVFAVVEFSSNDLEIVSTSTLRELNSDVPNDTVSKQYAIGNLWRVQYRWRAFCYWLVINVMLLFIV